MSKTDGGAPVGNVGNVGNSGLIDLSDVPDERIPRHIAIIMDGNGRWAVRRGLERIRGHEEGARTVRDVVTECARLHKHRGGPDFLTLYSFSLENWKRPVSEVSFLMQMYIEYLRSERPTMMENNIRFRQIGGSTTCPSPCSTRSTSRWKKRRTTPD